MLIYLVHPKHGRMPVYTEKDAEYNVQFGWGKEVEMKPVVAFKQEVPRGTIETPEAAYEKKFGKKPHHKMKLETIIKRLENETN